MKSKLVIIVSIAALLLSCNAKRLAPSSDDFVGTWYAKDYVLIIEKDKDFKNNKKFIVTDNYPNMEPINVSPTMKGDYIDGKIKFGPFGFDDITFLSKTNQIKYQENLYTKKEK